jgi:hypothetical protein
MYYCTSRKEVRFAARAETMRLPSRPSAFWLLVLQLPCGRGFGTLFKAMFNRSSSGGSAPCQDDTDSCIEWAAAGGVFEAIE